MAIIILNKDAVFAGIFDLHVLQSNTMGRGRAIVLNANSMIVDINSIHD